MTLNGTEIPWGAILSFLVALGSAVLGLVLKNQLTLKQQVTELHLTINSKMDAYIAAAIEKAHAAGVLEEKTRGEALAATRAAGVAERKETTP